MVLLDENYEIQKWKGKDKYQCKLCAFDSMKLETIQQHLRDHEEYERTKNQKVAEPTEVLILDRNGKPMNNIWR